MARRTALPPPLTAPRYASYVLAGEYAGVSGDTIRRMVRRGEIKTYRVGRQVRVDLNELDVAMARAAGRVA